MPPPFWAFPWAGGQALARYLLDEPGRVRGQVVLDLASGSGLVAIAAAVAGAASVIPSETDPLAVAAIALNAGVNRVQLEPTLGDLLGTPGAAALDPGDPGPGDPGPGDPGSGEPEAGELGPAQPGQGLPGSGLGPGSGPAAGVGVVLVGDAFYDRDMAARLLPFLDRARQGGALVLVGDPGRAYLPRDRFTRVAAYDVPVERVIEDADVKPSTVWRLR